MDWKAGGKTCARAAALAAACAVLSGMATGSQERIRSILEGNSIIHPSFGCVYYDTSGRLTGYRNGTSWEGRWWVEDGLYHSDSSCGGKGCWLSRGASGYVFRRTDHLYEQPVIVIHGNYCVRDAVIS